MKLLAKILNIQALFFRNCCIETGCGIWSSLNDRVGIIMNFNLRLVMVHFKEGPIPAEEKVLSRRASTEDLR